MTVDKLTLEVNEKSSASQYEDTGRTVELQVNADKDGASFNVLDDEGCVYASADLEVVDGSLVFRLWGPRGVRNDPHIEACFELKADAVSR